MHDDPLDDLFGSPKVTPANPRPAPPATYKPAGVIEACAKCNGTGRFITYSGRNLGPCFSCKGAGRKTFAKPAAERARAREQSALRKMQKLTDKIAEFRAREPAVAAWIDSELSRPEPFVFAVNMAAALNQWGDLTDKQLATCQRLAQAAAERAANRSQAAANAPAADSAGVDRLRQAFDAAKRYAAEKGLTMRKPKITVGDMVIAPAPEHGKNPGAIYVQGLRGSDLYYGKITGGRFHAARDCTPDRAEKILAFVADPKHAAEAYGQTTGTCCICNATLISKWKHRGIGPICAEKYGW
jgi:hypothetical protein